MYSAVGWEQHWWWAQAQHVECSLASYPFRETVVTRCSLGSMISFAMWSSPGLQYHAGTATCRVGLTYNHRASYQLIIAMPLLPPVGNSSQTSQYCNSCFKAGKNPWWFHSTILKSHITSSCTRKVIQQERDLQPRSFFN